MKPLSIISFLTLFLSSCLSGVAQQVNSLIYEEIMDIPYYASTEKSSDKQKLNLVLPKDRENVPLLVWIGGGAWSYVDRSKEMDLARRFAQEGIAVASVGHRLSPATWKDPAYTQGISHPEHIKDVARAFKWLYNHAAEYGYSQQNIFVGGYSSGGHLAALLSLDGKYLKNEGIMVSAIKGVIPVAGAYDISHYYEVLSNANGKQMADAHVKAVFGETQEHFIQASPTPYIESMSVPMLLISESNTYRYTKVLEDKIKQTGFKHLEVLHFQDIDHSGLWKHLSFEQQSIYRDPIIQYIKAHTTVNN